MKWSPFVNFVCGIFPSGIHYQRNKNSFIKVLLTKRRTYILKVRKKEIVTFDSIILCQIWAVFDKIWGITFFFLIFFFVDNMADFDFHNKKNVITPKKTVSFPYKFFFFHSNRTLLSSKKNAKFH